MIMGRPGKNSGHAGLFKKGHSGFGRAVGDREIEVKPQIKRLTKTVFSKVAKLAPTGLLYAPDADGQPGPVTLLRPKGGTEEVTDLYMQREPNCEINEMRLINKAKNALLWNTTFREHTQVAKCDDPHFTVCKEIKKGLGWRQSLKCTNCDYISQMFKLYNEVPHEGRGPKTASCNSGLQVGLQDSAIGNTKARLIIASTNTPPPALSGMQKLSSSVGRVTNAVNAQDMMSRKQEVTRTNQLRGLPANSPINVSMDVRYNSSTIISSHKMGQNASQAIGISLEHQTDKKQIVSFHMQNKLCWVGAYLRNHGFHVDCPGHADCTATMCEADPLSEKVIGEKIGADLAESGLLVQYVTTDGDARGCEGIRTAMERVHPTVQVERQADTTHLGQSQFRQTIKAEFSEGMFPGTTPERRKEQQKFLGLDMKNRCHAILSILHKTYAGNIHAIAKKMPKIIETILDCYSGDCSGCRYNGVTCGGGRKKNWWNQSLYLSRCGLTGLTVTLADRAILKALLQLRLGVESLRMTRLNLNTNKNEAVNRGLSASLPKNVNFSRNCIARASSAIHRLNHGAGASLIKKLEAVGSPISKGGHVARAVKHMQTASQYHLSYTKKSSTKVLKKYNKIRHMQEYLRAKYLRRVRPDYKKGHLDPIISAISGECAKVGHAYSLRKRGQPQKEHCEHTYFKPLHYI